MINVHTGSQGGGSIPPYVSGNVTTTRQDRHNPRCKTGKALGIHRVGSCSLPSNSLFWHRASAAKWL